MAQILFGQSYYLRFDTKLWRAMQPYPPLGTLYAASYMRERGYQIALFDAMLAESTAEWDAALAKYQPRYAVLFEDNFNYLSKMSLLRMRDAAFEMIGMAKKHGCIMIVAGADMTDHAEKYLEHGADYVLIGEGEETLAELVDYLETNTNRQDAKSAETEAEIQPPRREERQENAEVIEHDNISHPIVWGGATERGVLATRHSSLDTDLYAIKSLAYIHQGRVVKTPPRPVIKKLDDLPFPAWDLVDAEQYRAIWKQNHGYFSVNMVTTRGCPFHCNWCAKPIWGQRYGVRSPQSVVAEMAWLQANWQPDHIWFMDDIMGIQDRWIEEFADELDAQNVHIPFKSLNRVDLLLRGKTIPALARAGAKIVWVGAESGSQKILDAMDKGTQVTQIYEATRQLHAHGVKVAFFLQFGYPGETREDIELTLKMVRDLMPDDIGISVSYPLPGTPFYERVQHELGERVNWIDSEDMAMLYQGPFTTAFYRQLHTVVHKDYRSRKTVLALREVLRNPANLRPSVLRDTAAMLYHRLTLPAAQAKLDALARVPHEPTRLPNVVLQ